MSPVWCIPLHYNTAAETLTLTGEAVLITPTMTLRYSIVYLLFEKLGTAQGF